MSNILFQPIACLHCQGELPESREMGNFCDLPCFEAFDKSHGDLHDYQSGMYVRPATKAQADASSAAAMVDGGHGIIQVNGISCYVQP
jgi:hypothetical protein